MVKNASINHINIINYDSYFIIILDINEVIYKLEVDYDDPFYSPWVHGLIQGLVAKVTTSPIYFTRGYTFHTYEYESRRATVNYGICVKGETYIYGILQEIIEVEF